MKIPKGQSGAVIRRRTDNIIAKLLRKRKKRTKGQPIIYVGLVFGV
jgi:hypothetical protein